MSIFSRHGGVLVIKPKGALREDTIVSLHAEVIRETRGGLPLIAIDLSDTQLIDGAGLDWILALDDQAGQRGGAVRLCNACDLCQDLLRITVAGEQLDHFDSLVDALRSFSQ
jgi:anti-sigma B factor antagonist